MSSVLGDPDTFAAHVRGFEAGYREGEADGVQKERTRIKDELLTEFGYDRRIINVLGRKRVLGVVLDRICPEP